MKVLNRKNSSKLLVVSALAISSFASSAFACPPSKFAEFKQTKKDTLLELWANGILSKEDADDQTIFRVISSESINSEADKEIRNLKIQLLQVTLKEEMCHLAVAQNKKDLVRMKHHLARVNSLAEIGKTIPPAQKERVVQARPARAAAQPIENQISTLQNLNQNLKTYLPTGYISGFVSIITGAVSSIYNFVKAKAGFTVQPKRSCYDLLHKNK